jgi:hypothetical protein
MNRTVFFSMGTVVPPDYKGRGEGRGEKGEGRIGVNIVLHDTIKRP